MSPFCPSCLGVSREGEARCPLDQHFFHRRNCRECGLLDYFTFTMVTILGLASIIGFWTIFLVLPASFLYRAMGRSNGRQTFGQAIFYVMTVSRDAGPAGRVSTLERGLWELVLIPKSVIDSKALASLERRTGTMEVALL